jgi:CarboxypepD_reg-like domain/TonB-dependent Receptor Plug Domain
LLKIGHLIFIILLLGIVSNLNAQSKFTLSGYVRDANTGEDLIGVTVYIPSLKSGVVTNVYGFYSLTLPSATYSVHYSYVGYGTQNIAIDLQQDVKKDIELAAEVETMAEVVITGEAEDLNVTSLEISTERIDISQLKKMPSIFGEPDLIKMVQMMPGVITAGEGTSSYFVRGGSADQNLILIDEAPIYDPSHLFGYISVFNSDVIKDSKLYKGGIPANFGGRLSSILDVRTIDGNKKKFAGHASIGTLASKVMLEGPIKKDVGSYLISARRSYADLFLKIAGNQNSVFFYDVNAKVNWNLGPKDKIFVAGYFGRDAFSLGGNFGFDWGNATGTIRWNHLFSNKLFSNTSIITSKFDYGLGIDDPAIGFLWTSVINEYSLKQRFTWFLSPAIELDFGYNGTFRVFRPGKITANDATSIFEDTELQKLQALDHALFISNKHTILDKISLEYGVRLSIFQQIGPSTVYTYADPQDNVNITITGTEEFSNGEPVVTYVNWEPRFSGRFILDESSSVKVSYNRMVQNVHLISSGTVPLPFNTWYPSSTYLKPQIADQVAMGYFRNLRDNMFTGSTEIFYKWLNNVTDFADNADIFFNEHIATEFRQGKAWSYGFEAQLKKVKGDFTGFINYTWSKTERQIPDVNQGKVFFANYDRRNALNLLGAYELSDKWSFSSTFTYSSGRPITLPTGQYSFQQFRPTYVTERNGYKLPAYHRLDVSAVLVPRKNKARHIQTKWVFSIYNIYNRKNAFTVFSQDKEIDNVKTGSKEYVMIYLFPIIPSVTFNMKF